MIRWGHPSYEFEVPKPFYIEGITRNIHLLGGGSSPLNFEAFGITPDSIFLELIPSSNDTSVLFIMNKDSNGIYSHVIDEVYEDYRYRAISPSEYFWQAWEKVATPYYYISVTDRPIMEEFSIKISPPKYSGLPISIQKGNQSDVRALKGSSIRIDLKSNRKLKNGFLNLDNQKTPLKIRGKRAAGGFVFKEDAIELGRKLTFFTYSKIFFFVSSLMSEYPAIAFETLDTETLNLSYMSLSFIPFTTRYF